MHKGVKKKKNEFINDALFSFQLEILVFFFFFKPICCHLLFISLFDSFFSFYFILLLLFKKKKKKASVFVYSLKHKLKVIQKYKTLNYRLHFYPTLLSSGLIPILNSPFLLFKIILFLFLFHKNPFLFHDFI